MAFNALSVVRGPGEIALMVVEVTKRIFTRPFQMREFLEQAWFVTSVTLVPTIMVSIPFGAVISLQVANLTGQLGAESFAGATAVLATVREAAPMAAAMIIAGAAGSAICSDLGARTIREEVDALKVMGISPVHRLVAPRIVAAVVVALLLNVIVATTAILTGFALNVGSGSVSSGTYLGSFVGFAQPSDLFLAELKAAVFGFIATIVAAHKGLSATGGPKGVADAVNQSVVLSFILLALVNVAMTQAYVMLVPQRIA